MDAVGFTKKREGAGNPIAGFSRETGHPCSTKNCSLAALEGLVTLNAAVWNAKFAAPEHDPGTDLQLLQADYRNTIYLLKSNRMISFSYDQPIAFTEASVKSSLRCLMNRICLIAEADRKYVVSKTCARKPSTLDSSPASDFACRKFGQ